jgi:hypothetical protein
MGAHKKVVKMLSAVRDEKSLKNEVEYIKRQLDDLYDNYLPIIRDKKQKPLVVGQDIDWNLIKTLEKFVPQNGQEYFITIKVKHRQNGIRWEVEDPKFKEE